MRTPPEATQLSWHLWRLALRAGIAELTTDQVSLVAAGCAFYATLALFPALSMVIALYGLAFDPNTVVPHLEMLRDLLPAGADGYAVERPLGQLETEEGIVDTVRTDEVRLLPWRRNR